MSFHVGQKVVCVSSPLRGIDCDFVPLKGSIYTVRGYSDSPYLPGVPAIYLEEIVNPPFDYGFWIGEVAFKAHRFRPVIERKTDTGFAILEEIRKRESFPDRIKEPSP